MWYELDGCWITLVSKTKFSSLLKFRVILLVLTLLNPNMTTKLPSHPPIVKEKGLTAEATFVIQKINIWFFSYNVQYQLMNGVSVYNILTTKKK
jgi:hypothetical protein